jgi:hypothetical protein
MPAENLQAASCSAVPIRNIGTLLISPITNVVYYINQTGSRFKVRYAVKDRYLNEEIDILFLCRCPCVVKCF